MAKPDIDAALAAVNKDHAPNLRRLAEEPKLVRFRFTCDHTHTHMGLPFTNGDEINIEPAWADVIEAMGSGHRLTDKE